MQWMQLRQDGLDAGATRREGPVAPSTLRSSHAGTATAHPRALPATSSAWSDAKRPNGWREPPCTRRNEVAPGREAIATFYACHGTATTLRQGGQRVAVPLSGVRGMVEYHALGPVTVTDEVDRELPVGGPRQRRLMAMLLIHRNSVVSVDRLAEAVFAGEPTPAAATTLRSYVARLRRVVERNGNGTAARQRRPVEPPHAVAGLQARGSRRRFDVARFEALLANGRAALDRDDAVSAASDLRARIALWHGEPYAEFADEDWVRAESQRLHELLLVAHERLVDAELACGRDPEAVSELERLVVEHPLRDGFRERLDARPVPRRPTGRCAAGVPGPPSRARRGARARTRTGAGRSRTPNPRTRPGLLLTEPAGRPTARVPDRRTARDRPRGHRPRGATSGRRARARDPRLPTRKSRTDPTSCAISKPTRSASRRSATMRSSRCTTTGASPALRIW